MVATFRRDTPNMSYVNVSTGVSDTNSSNVVMPVPDEEMNDLTSARSSIRGNILRSNGSNLLTDLVQSMPELHQLVVGGPSTSHEQLQTSYDQQQYYDGDLNLRTQPQQTFGGLQQPRQAQAAAGHNNINYSLGGGASGLSQPHESSSFRGYVTNTSNGETLSSASSFSNSSNNQPRLRVATLPRASNSFGNHQENCNSLANPELPRSYSSCIPSDQHLSNNHNDGAFGFDSGPRITVIRTTSTLEITSGGSPPPHQLNNSCSSQPQMNGVSSQLHHPGAGMSFQQQSSQQSMFGSGHSYPQPAQLNAHDVGGGHRRAQRQARHRATVSAASGSRTGDHLSTEKVVKDLLKNQETLVKENEDLKRKLHLLVSTFKDEQKLNKVLRCLEEKRKATHPHSMPTS